MEQAGIRPVLAISHSIFNHRSGTVIALAITSQAPTAGFPLTLELITATLPKRSWVKISQIHTLSVERLASRLGAITPEELDEVIEGLNEIVCKLSIAISVCGRTRTYTRPPSGAEISAILAPICAARLSKRCHSSAARAHRHRLNNAMLITTIRRIRSTDGHSKTPRVSS
ncbi:MAG: type II toxin-antitoxin system PemK/MazF family toxin [Kouleothrix sp.]|nr:type II toxin-antitoxin system PemK/MazF family toxin [Kouleothrix sp.]